MSRLETLSANIDSREARIGVVGLGYVGLPLALEFAKAGFRVTGFDVDPEKVRVVSEGGTYIEDVPAEDVARESAAGRLSASTDFAALSSMDVINVCVPTPLTKTKDPDVSHIVRAVEEIRKRLRSGQLVILGSTTYPGTTHDLFVPLLEESGLECGSDFAVAFAPERIDPANKDFEVRAVPKVVGGETAYCTDLGVKIYQTIFDTVVPVSSTQSAEMVKLLENTFRAINIGLANEVALMCDRLGLDVWEVIEAAATKPYGFMKFLPGPGLGGHCIPVDPTYLAWKMKSLNFKCALHRAGHRHQRPHARARRGHRRRPAQRGSPGGQRRAGPDAGCGVQARTSVTCASRPAIDIIKPARDQGRTVIRYHDPHVAELPMDDRNATRVSS